MRRVLGLAVPATLALGIATMVLPGPSSTARADVFGPISLLSQRAISRTGSDGQLLEETQQADYAHDPAVSGNGLYVAFDGSFGGVSGVWRRDLQTGVVERVDACPAEQGSCIAELPSISENGQYVSFTTTARLTSGDRNSGPDVYVRAMEKAVPKPQAMGQAVTPSEAEIDESGAFTLASAVNGSEEGLTYEFPDASTEEEKTFDEAHYGSVASGRSALSSSGEEVAFVTTAGSNLSDPKTPALQVAVRNLASKTTELVSVAYDPQTGSPAVNPSTGAQEPVSAEEGGRTYGAVYSPSLPPPGFNAPAAYAPQSPIGASISADGSTVAWMGQDVSRQAPVLSAESLPAMYSEPLWRRIGSGPNAPTRRITGGSDPAGPTCASSGETALPEVFSSTDPCQGPFRTEALGVWIGGTGNPVPQLSRNGMTVAFLASAPPIEGNFGADVLERASDIYVVNMAAGLSRVQALTALTELASGNTQEPATTAPIVDLGISPDGGQVAFTTQRTVFPLGSPAFVSPPAATPGMAELFDVDLANDTLTRVTRSFEGGPSEAPHPAESSGEDPYSDTDGALSPSFSNDGDTLVFSSTAANLAYGDGNTPPQTGSLTFDGSDVFAVSRTVFDTTAPPQEVSSPPAGPPLLPAWSLGVSALSQKNGNVLLEVETPGAGQLHTVAQSAVRVVVSHSASTRHGTRKHRVSSATVLTRTVATTSLATHGAGFTAMTLKLEKPYAALDGEHGGLSASVTVTLRAPGHAAVHQSIAVTFVRSERPKPRKGETHGAVKRRKASKKASGR
jgi:WD40-like Beta Propeller Repeat